jgi:hypothetical protein
MNRAFNHVFLPTRNIDGMLRASCWTGLSRPAIVLTAILLAAPVCAADEASEKVIDSSKPTSIYSKMDIGLEYNNYQDGKSYGPRLTYTTAVGATVGLEIGAALLYPDFNFPAGQEGSKSLQLSDTRIRALWTPAVLQRKPGLGYYSAGLYVDSVLPTGDQRNRVGSGSTTIAPGFMAGFGLNEKATVSVFPIVSYVSSLRKVDCNELGTLELPACGAGAATATDEVRAMRLDLPLILNFPSASAGGRGNQAFIIWPSYTKLTSHDRSSVTALELTYQYMLTPKTNISVNLKHPFTDRDAPGAQRDTTTFTYTFFF